MVSWVVAVPALRCRVCVTSPLAPSFFAFVHRFRRLSVVPVYVEEEMHTIPGLVRLHGLNSLIRIGADGLLFGMFLRDFRPRSIRWQQPGRPPKRPRGQSLSF